jgi:hypothetical protein
MSEGFTITNFRHVAKGLQPGQFAVGERKKAVGLADLDPIYKQLLISRYTPVGLHLMP